ncbi:hypothetical protein ACLK13_02160 [Escherichia coli]
MAEPLVQQQGGERIIVELPGIAGHRPCQGDPGGHRDPGVPHGR